MEQVSGDVLLLESLNMLNNSESSKKEFSFPDVRTARSSSCGGGSRSRNDSSPSACYIPTKENALNLNQPGRGVAMLYCAAGSNKMHFRRIKHRPCPYEVNKRKPLNSLINPMGRLGMMGHGQEGRYGTVTTRVRSSDSYSESRNGRDHDSTLMPLFDEEYHDLPFRDGLNYGKTDKFPVSILSRSKSLEDLRESPNKQGSKQVRFKLVCYDDNSNGTLSSNGSNSLESPVSPRTSFFNVLKGEASIKNEIDSMSMLIEKLDVA